MSDWGLKRRWEILQGQTLNMVWNDLSNDDSKDFKQKLKALKDRFPQLLEVNAKLVTGEENSSPGEVEK